MKINSCLSFILFLLLSNFAKSSPLIFSNSFETPSGSIEFVSAESVLMTQIGDSADFEVLVKDHLGNTVHDGVIQWTLSSSMDLATSNIQSRSVSVDANSFSVSTVVLNAYHAGVNATASANLILAEINSLTKVILDTDVISGMTPVSGAQSTIVLHKNSRTDSIQVSDYVISGQNTGILVLVDQVTIGASEVTITASAANLTQVFETFKFNGVSQKSNYYVQLSGKDKSIKVLSHKGGQLIEQKALIDSFECELEGGGSAGISLDGASIDFDFTIEVKPIIDISLTGVDEFSIVAQTNSELAATTGSVNFSSGISGNVLCKATLSERSSPRLFVSALSFQLATTPELGFMLNANINGPSATLTGPTGIVTATNTSGIKYTSSNQWEYIKTSHFGFEYDSLVGEFSTDIDYAFNAEVYGLFGIRLNAQLGLPPFGIDFGHLEFMQAKASENFEFAITSPLDPNHFNYTGPTAELSGHINLSPKAELSSELLDPILDTIGISTTFNLALDPILQQSYVHWSSPSPALLMPSVLEIDTPIQIIVSSSNNTDDGSFNILSETLGPFNGSINNGMGAVPWTPLLDDIGQHNLYPRLSVDGLSQLLPYASDSPQQITVTDELLITDIVFADANLEACVLQYANDRGWTRVEEMIQLDCRDSQIIELSGIESFYNLEHLNLLRNDIVDLNPLSTLTQLLYLNLHDNQIMDVTPLSALTQLPVLLISSNHIIDITQLNSLTKLTTLVIGNNPNLNIDPLSALTQLTFLELSSIQLIDLSPLSSLSQLQSLQLSGNQIVDLSPINSLILLNSLSLNSNQIIDISALNSLTQLNTLDLADNQIVNVLPLNPLTQLTSLDLNSNNVTDITGLGSLTQLEILRLNNNNINEISSLNNLTQLYSLTISNNQITTIPQLNSLTQLVTLTISNNQIMDVTPLSPLTQLRGLYLSFNQINDISSLVSLTELNTFYVSSNDFNIPCDQLALFTFVTSFQYDTHYDVNQDGVITIPPDEVCGPF